MCFECVGDNSFEDCTLNPLLVYIMNVWAKTTPGYNVNVAPTYLRTIEINILPVKIAATGDVYNECRQTQAIGRILLEHELLVIE